MRRLLALLTGGMVVAAAAGTSATAALGATDAGTDVALRPHCAALAVRLAIPPDDSRYQRGNCDDRVCAAAGGQCAYAGFCFGQACVKKTHDAGYACNDGSQCEGLACIARSGAEAGPGTGACTPVQITLGCHVYVVHGVVSGASLCGD